jgi:hypothetical protein
MTDLIEFLRARLDEDERCWRDMQGAGEQGYWDFMLAEVDAKRRILEYAEQAIAGAAVDDHDPQRTAPAAEYELYVLPALALPHADHPDYRDEWRR